MSVYFSSLIPAFATNGLKQAISYLPAATIPAVTKGTIQLAAAVGIFEIWSRTQTTGYKNVRDTNLFDSTIKWNNYPSAVLAAFLTYHTFNNQALKTIAAATLLITPLAAKKTSQFIVAKQESDQLTAYESDDEYQETKSKTTVQIIAQQAYDLLTAHEEKIKAVAELAYDILTIVGRAALISFAAYIAWKDLTTKAPAYQLLISAMSTAALIEAAGMQQNLSK